MSVSWTTEQQQVIDLRNRNILVSAAAGSGKTAVLVERIIKRITEKENPIDIDRLLVVTFTNAAAAEMRERIGAAIEKALMEQPEDEHLQRQLSLIHNAQITTIDSFCLYVIRNHFHEIDLEPNFRIGDEGELKLLKEDVLNAVLEQDYERAQAGEAGSEAFLKLVESYAAGRSDEALREMVLRLYEFSKSYPWPEEWLASCARGYDIADVPDLDAAEFMQPLVSHIRQIAGDLVALTEDALALAKDDDGPFMYQKALESDLEKYKEIAESRSFSEFYEGFSDLSYDRLASSKNFDGSADKLEQVKALRDGGKETVKKLVKQYFFASLSAMVSNMQKTAPMADELVALTLRFSEAFAAEKRKKNLVDFHDLEHFALEILVDRETKEIRKTAEEFQDTFAEIMIDEYQDSNEVQETILKAISKESRDENNIFMVGDVKQSIYRFRLARPELFMEKYDTYTIEESKKQRIDLHKNFRSREQVLRCTNDIFDKIMGKDLGNVAYDAAAALYPGASYPDAAEPMFTPEILLTDVGGELFLDSEQVDKRELEAKLIAERIKKLMEEQLVTDKKTGELRKASYSDVVILLRSLSSHADKFAKVLSEEGIPAHTVSATGYFSAVEVQTVLAMLRILDNPRQDIPLTAVLKSPIVGLTDEELALLRLREKDIRFHLCVQEACEEAAEKEGERTPFEQKLAAFYQTYHSLRKRVPDTPIHELIELLLKETGYGDYAAAMPAGDRRIANLQMLVEKAIAYENTSYKGLFHFVRYIDELQKYDVDYGEADLISENEDVVRIMSIHKSKGLEFPIVFVAGMGKNFNKQDTRSRMVLHPEYGMGLDCMDGEQRTKANTIIKKAIAKQIDLENLGEELRVLYVALTRAKEKLILTGIKKDAEETLKKYRVPGETEMLSYLAREEAAGYLDWVLPAVLSYGEKYQIQIINPAELVLKKIKTQMDREEEREKRLQSIKNAGQSAMREQIARRFETKYPHQSEIGQKNKYSVSELKHRAMREQMQQEEESTPVFAPEEIVPYIPAFAREMEQLEEEVNQGALRGTAVHRVMECYDFAAKSSVEEQMQQMCSQGKLTPELKELVKVPLITRFLETKVGERMALAQEKGMLYREKPFVMGFTGEELRRFGFAEADQEKPMAEGDLTLIQGIIDVFWMEEDGITLLDYKTDRVQHASELKVRYEAQLKLYEEAVNRVYRGTGQKVKELLLYSFRLGEFVQIK